MGGKCLWADPFGPPHHSQEVDGPKVARSGCVEGPKGAPHARATISRPNGRAGGGGARGGG